MSEKLTVQGASMTATTAGIYYELQAADITLTGLGNDTMDVYGQRNHITFGGSGNVLYFDDADNTLIAGDGNNTIGVYGGRNLLELGDGNNEVINTSRNTSVLGGDGENYILINGSGNLVTLGNGGNTIEGVALQGTELEEYADFNVDNTLTGGDGADVITVAGDENFIYGGDGNDTVVVEGNENLILTGYPEWVAELDDETEEPSTLDDNDVMTVRGNENVISTGRGANRAELIGKENFYDGTGADTVRANLSNSSLMGVIDLEINGEENAIELAAGGRLRSTGDGSQISLTGGAFATVSGNQLEMTVEGSSLQLDGFEAQLLISNATIEASTLTSASFTIQDELTLNGQVYKGATTLNMFNADSLSATAGDTPLEGFAGVAIDFDDMATLDGVIYSRVTVPAEVDSDDDNVITIKDHEVTNLGWNEGLMVSEDGHYTVNGYEFDVTPYDIIAGTNDWAGLLSINIFDDIVHEGTAFNDNLINLGDGVTVDSGLGVDYVSLASASREFLVFDGEGSVEVEGFATGFDSVSDVLTVKEVEGYDWSIKFGITGVDIEEGDSIIHLINSGYESVDFLLQDGDNLLRVTALNEGVTTEATEADYYFLNDKATLFAGDGSFMVNGITLPEEYLTGSTVIGSSVASDYAFTAFDVLSPTLGEYSVQGIAGDAVIDSVDASGQFFVFDGTATVNDYSGAGILEGLQVATDGQVTIEVADHEIKSILGLDAGEEVTVGSMSYIVSEDGASIRNGDGGLMWTGSDVAAVNVLELEEIPDDTTSETPPDDTTSEAPVDDTTSTAPVDDTTSTAPVDDTTSTAPVDDTTSTAPVDDTTSTAPVDDTTSTAPVDDTTSTAPVDDTTSTAPVDDTTSTAPVDDTTSTAPVDDTTSIAPIDDTTSTAPVDDTTSIVPIDDTTSIAPADDTTFALGTEGKDSITVDGNALVDISSGGRDTIEVISGAVDVVGYDVTTRSAFAVDGVSTFDANGFAGDNFSVKLEGDHSNGFFAAIVEDGSRHFYGWNDTDGVIDGSSFDQPLIVFSNGWSTVSGGSKDDIIFATGGDIIQLTRGHDLILIGNRMKGDFTIDLGTHLTHTTVAGFDDDVVKVEDINDLKVKVTDYGMQIRAGNAHLTLADVEDTVRVTDGESEFVLRTDYRDMLPNVDYVLEDENRIVRTPDGALTIDDDLFIFNGGADVVIDGFDDRWQLQAGEGVEVDRVTTLVNGTVKFTTNNGSLKLRK